MHQPPSHAPASLSHALGSLYRAPASLIQSLRRPRSQLRYRTAAFVYGLDLPADPVVLDTSFKTIKRSGDALDELKKKERVRKQSMHTTAEGKLDNVRAARPRMRACIL